MSLSHRHIQAGTAQRAPAVSSQAGFTLLELLVAVTIMALLSVALFLSFRIAVNSYRTGQERIEREAEKRVLEDQIKRQIGSLFPLRPALSLANLQRQGIDPAQALAYSQIPLFYGTPESVTFVTVAPMLLRQNPGLTVVRYGLAERDGVRSLAAMESRFLGVDSFTFMANDPRGSTLPLIRPVRDVRFEYYGFDVQAQAYGWSYVWNAEQTHSTPSAVRIHVDERVITVPVNATFISMTPFPGMQGGSE